MKLSHIIAVAVVVVVGIGSMVAFKLFDDATLTASTDSANVEETINIGVDNWAGYYVLCSKEARRLALEKKVLIKCHDDKADYPDRMMKLKDGVYQMAAATVDGYVMTGADAQYPGSVMFVIDESQGGDAIIANKNVATNIDDLVGKSFRLTYTPNSPSQTLATAWSNDFNVPINDPSVVTIVPSNGSSDALKKLLNGEADVAILWEPDVSKALANANFGKLLGTESTKNLIVDVLLGNQRYLKDNPEYVQIVTEAYFKALEYYKKNSVEREFALASYADVKPDQVDSISQGINWIDLPHNGVDWLGIGHGNVKGQRQLYDTIEASVKLYMNSGDLATNPLPDNDPFRIINTGTFQQVFSLGMSGNLGVAFAPITSAVDVSVTRSFKKLSPGRWTKLAEVGSLRLQPITFKRGTSVLEPVEQESFRKLVEMLKTYPNYRIKVVGHTGRRGDNMANMNLSKQRALTAARHLMNEYGLDKNRIYAYGVGNTQPPIRLPGEKKRAYSARWPRVELILVEGS